MSHLVVLDETLTPGAQVTAATLAGPVVELLQGPALQLLTAAPAGGVHRDLLPAADLLYPGHLAITRDHLLHHDLHLGGGHTVRNTPLVHTR